MNFLLIILLGLMQLGNSGSLQTETHQDLIATLSQNNSPLLTRVIKFVNIEYPLSLVVGRVWSQVPDFAMIIDLPHSEAVSIRYNLQIWSPSNGLLITRVVIDGRQYSNYLVTTGYTVHHNNWSQDTTWLSKGKHEIKVQYSNSVSFPSLWIGHSLTAANFKVEYFTVR